LLSNIPTKLASRHGSANNSQFCAPYLLAAQQAAYSPQYLLSQYEEAWVSYFEAQKHLVSLFASKQNARHEVYQ